MISLEALEEKKKKLDKYRPFSPELIKNLDEWFKVELTYTSNAIEGNTLTRQETALVIEKNLTVSGKTLTEHLEAKNHSNALEYIHTIKKTLKEINQTDILSIHEIILSGIDNSNAGKYRSVPVRISGSTVIMPNPIKVPDLMIEFINWLNTTNDHPITIAIKAHYKFVTIHPFTDGNGRTARLLMTLILLISGYPPSILGPEDRLEYINNLESAQLGGSLDPFTSLMRIKLDKSLDIYLDAQP